MRKETAAGTGLQGHALVPEQLGQVVLQQDQEPGEKDGGGKESVHSDIVFFLRPNEQGRGRAAAFFNY